MKINTLKLFVASVIILIISSGCTFDTREDWDKLQDRKFYFSEFQYILLDQSKEDAYIFFKNFPVKKIMFMLAKEYNISIDISDFKNFISTNKPSTLQSDGFVRTEKNTWKKQNNENNRILFTFERDYFDSSKLKFSISIYSGNTLLKVMKTDISKIEYIYTQLNFQLKTGKESLIEYSAKNYDAVSPIPMIIETNNNSSDLSEPADVLKIKLMIDDYVKTLDQNGKNDFKHDIIDYIYEKCK